MATMILGFGKNKGKQLGKCEESYLKWLASHENVLSLKNRWASYDARFELERREMVAAPVVVEEIVEIPAPVVAEAPKQTYRIVRAPGPKRGRYDLLSEIEAKRESRFAMLGEINAIKARKRSEDLGLKGNFGNKGFQLMR